MLSELLTNNSGVQGFAALLVQLTSYEPGIHRERIKEWGGKSKSEGVGGHTGPVLNPPILSLLLPREQRVEAVCPY